MSLEVHTISPKKFLPKINDSYEHNFINKYK